MKRFRYLATALAAAMLAGCTVHQTETPALAGPSDLALSLSMTAVPDTISQDGGSQSAVKVLAKGPDGKAIPSLPLRVEMRAPDASGHMVPQDFGTLSARTIVTGSDGVASVIFTAPPSPVGGITGTCSGLTGICVEIVATPTATNFGTVNPASATIRLVPPGVILPPAGTPTASFTITPTPVSQGASVTFDASASTPGAGAAQITAFGWSFGDGSSASGKTVSHTFTTAATFNVTLTVTNDRGLSASTSQAVSVGGVAVPKADFVFSPSSPQAGQLIVFDAETSTAAAGHTISAFSWNFGDGTGSGSTASGLVVSHAFATAGTFTVVLTIADDLGQKSTTSKTVGVAGGSGSAGTPTAAFTFSPSAPGLNQDVFFNASTSTASSGHAITSYAWDFGDGATGSGVTVTHQFQRAGTFTVTLTVTDDTSQKATTTKTVTVANTSSQIVADFTFSPTDPTAGQTVFFDATPSTTPSPPLTYAWDFGDGSAAPGNVQKPSHVFATANTWVVRLTITDAAGRTATVTKNVVVK
jgi:PKD repeat protein